MYLYKKIISALSLYLLCTASFATSNGAHPGHVSSPADGFIKTGLLMANGVIDPSKMMMFDMSYHIDVRKRSPEQIAEHRALAIAHIEDTFKINVAELESQGKVVFTPFILTSDMQYRVYSLSDTWVPSKGFNMADGGWVLMVTDPNGLELNSGQNIPAGSMTVYGEYYIMAENIAGKSQEPIIVHYQSDRFIVLGFYGEMPILCDIYHSDWGWGKAQGVAFLIPDIGGMNANTRNVFTFTGSDHSKPNQAVWFE